MKEKNMIRILIADDHQMLLDGLRSFLSIQENIHIVGEATNGHQVLDILGYNTVDVAIIDITMPEMDGYQTVLEIKQKHPQTKVIILSFHKDETHIGKLLRAGVSGYVIKDTGSEELVKAINLVANGKKYLDPEIPDITYKATLSRINGSNGEIRLTQREEDVLHLVVNGLTSKEIAEKLHIATTTVDTHRQNILKKLDLKPKQLISYAMNKGYGKGSLT